MKAFLDTSSLVKLYHQETDSKKVEDILLNGVRKIFLSEIAILEFRSAVWKKVREGEIDKEIAGRVISCFKDDYDNFQWVRLRPGTIKEASSLLMKYGIKGLRTLDSLQLASALTLKNEDCIFLTSDNLLESLFREENLNVV